MSAKDYGFLCLSSEFKGVDFMKAIAALGHRVYLVTSEDRKNKPWPFDILSDVFYVPGTDGRIWNLDDLEKGVAHVMRSTKIDRVIALDDYEVRKVSMLREVFRMPGMGQTTARHFHDKLAMRIQAQSAGIPQPVCTSLFNDDEVNAFIKENPAPWFLKRREDAGALGIRKAGSSEELWKYLNEFGDKRHQYLAECFVSGDVFHVDSLTVDGKILFTRASQYLTPPFDVAHGGGIFQSCTLPFDDPRHKELVALNAKVLHGFGMLHGASHTEFIRGTDGKYYFLETSARVGGAHLADLVHQASDVNLWSEWAKIESGLLQGKKYKAPTDSGLQAGIITSLSRVEHPDYSRFTDPEIAWTMDKSYHISFIFKSPDHNRVRELLDKYYHIIKEEFHATLTLKE
jgi:biotin carboxylase